MVDRLPSLVVTQLLLAVILTTQAGAQTAVEHCVVILLTGGARSQDLSLLPELRRAAKTGVLYDAVRCSSEDDAIATRAWLSGRPAGKEALAGIDRNRPGLDEHLRRARALAAHELWLVGAHRDLLARTPPSRAPRFGRDRAGRRLALESLRTPELARWAESLPGHAPLSPAHRKKGDALRRDLAPDPTAPAAVLEALGRASSALSQEGVKLDDVVTLETATELALGIKPRLMIVLLRDTEVAARSAEQYREVLRRLDASLARCVGRLRDPAGLGPGCAVFIGASHGFDKRETRGILGTKDGSPSVLKSWLFAWGPGFRTGQVVKASVASADLVPSIGRLMKFPVEGLEGRMLRQLVETR